MTSAIPRDYATVTPSLILKNCAKAIELYKNAFGAEQLDRIDYSDGSGVMHATIRIGNSIIMLGDETPNMKAAGANFYLYVPDVDASVKKAEAAGMKNIMAVEDMFWGDRLGCVVDEFGVQWSIATHVKDVSERELEEGAKKMEAMMKNC